MREVFVVVGEVDACCEHLVSRIHERVQVTLTTAVDAAALGELVANVSEAARILERAIVDLGLAREAYRCAE